MTVVLTERCLPQEVCAELGGVERKTKARERELGLENDTSPGPADAYRKQSKAKKEKKKKPRICFFFLQKREETVEDHIGPPPAPPFAFNDLREREMNNGVPHRLQ